MNTKELVFYPEAFQGDRLARTDRRFALKTLRDLLTSHAYYAHDVADTTAATRQVRRERRRAFGIRFDSGDRRYCSARDAHLVALAEAYRTVFRAVKPTGAELAAYGLVEAV